MTVSYRYASGSHGTFSAEKDLNLQKNMKFLAADLLSKQANLKIIKCRIDSLL